MNAPSESSPAPRRKRWAALALLALMFLLGIITGVGGGALVLRHRLQQRAFSIGKSPGASDLFIDRLEKEMSSGMNLTSDEKAVVKSELAVTRDQVHSIRQRAVLDLRATTRETLDRIKSKLPTEKRESLEARARERLGPWGLLPEK